MTRWCHQQSQLHEVSLALWILEIGRTWMAYSRASSVIYRGVCLLLVPCLIRSSHLLIRHIRLLPCSTLHKLGCSLARNLSLILHEKSCGNHLIPWWELSMIEICLISKLMAGCLARNLCRRLHGENVFSPLRGLHQGALGGLHRSNDYNLIRNKIDG